MSFDTGDADKRVAKYADESMFVAQRTGGLVPVVRLISGPNDPLGTLAFLAKTYQGIFPNNLAEIGDADRQYYIQDQEKNILGMPSEAIQFHFLIENVSRSFTHQLVRTRHASYAQESLRFAVKEDFPCGIPRYLEGTKSLAEETEGFGRQMGWVDSTGFMSGINYSRAQDTVFENCSDLQMERFKFDERNETLQAWYLDMIDQGWPAEDARGILPHWILTKINMVISLSSLMGMAGKRLCTQAQWEHKLVWDGILRALREYGSEQTYRTNDPLRSRAQSSAMLLEDPRNYGISEVGDNNGDLSYERSSAWQYEVLANRFKPVCYQTGQCQFRSDFDRYCNIRERVEANHKIGRPSSEWHTGTIIPIRPVIKLNPEPEDLLGPRTDEIRAIHPHEWLDPNAALRPDGEWRSDQAKANIAGRRL